MNQDDKEIKEILDWTSKQGRILTANGQAEKYYTPARGYEFREDELPHFYLLSKNHETHDVFASWAHKQKGSKKYPVCGAWTRPIFVGGFEYSSNYHEEVFNVQTNTLFIDMRIPKLGKKKIKELEKSGKSIEVGIRDGRNVDDNNVLTQFSNDQLRLYARRHAFAGYTILDQHDNRNVCTRHHCIDWNFVGKGRNRPNKWFVQMHPDHSNTWKEFAFAKDDFDQHYYFEQWERINGDANGNGLILSLRKRCSNNDGKKSGSNVDGIIVIVGNHFNYIFSRVLDGHEKSYGESLVTHVDNALASGDRKSAEAFVSIDAGHGTITSGWIIDCALQYWKEGTSLFSNDNGFIVKGSNIDSCSLSWNGSDWDIYESSIKSIDDLCLLFNWRNSQDKEYGSLENILFNKQSTMCSKKRKLNT